MVSKFFIFLVFSLTQLLAMPLKASTNDQVNLLVTAYNNSGLKLYQKLAISRGNIVISPLSIAAAMDMSLSGARGKTANQMMKVLQHNLQQDQIPKIHAKFFQKIKPSQKDAPTLKIANALFLPNKKIEIHSSYRKLITQKFKGGVFQTSDINDVNDWVKQKTSGKISKIIDNLPKDTAALLLNAVYFKGEWQHEFPDKDTFSEPFFLHSKEFVFVPSMKLERKLLHFKAKRYEAVALPFAGGTPSMIVILPEKQFDFPSFERSINKSEIKRLLASQGWNLKKINLSLPKFDLSFKSDLMRAFKDLGMRLPFNKSKADFRGLMYGDLQAKQNLTRDNQENIFIQDILHHAKITVDEKGAEAAAVTGTRMVLASRTSVHTFEVNRPFMFIIFDHTTNAILFLGRVVDPRQK